MLAAASKSHTACVAALCAAGARGLTVNKAGDSPLSLAVAAGNLEMLRLLVALPGSAALIKRKNTKGVHAMAVAISRFLIESPSFCSGFVLNQSYTMSLTGRWCAGKPDEGRPRPHLTETAHPGQF